MEKSNGAHGRRQRAQSCSSPNRAPGWIFPHRSRADRKERHIRRLPSKHVQSFTLSGHHLPRSLHTVTVFVPANMVSSATNFCSAVEGEQSSFVAVTACDERTFEMSLSLTSFGPHAEPGTMLLPCRSAMNFFFEAGDARDISHSARVNCTSTTQLPREHSDKRAGPFLRQQSTRRANQSAEKHDTQGSTQQQGVSAETATMMKVTHKTRFRQAGRSTKNSR